MNIENLSFLFYFTGTPTIFLVGYYVFLKDSRRLINRLFFLMSIAGSLWGLMGITERVFGGESFFYLGFYILGWFGIAFLPSLILQLSLFVIDKKELFKKIAFQLFLYLLPLFIPLFICVNIIIREFFPLYEEEIVKGFSPLVNIYLPLYFLPYFLIAIIALLKRYFSLKSLQEKTKLRFFIIGTFAPLILGFLIFFILPLFEIQLSWLPFPLFALGYLIIAQGVLRYGLFIDYREILETVFKKLTELVIVTDKEGLILLTNETILSKLNLKEEEVASKRITDFLKEGEEDWQKLKEGLQKQKGIFEDKIVFQAKDKEEIPFLLTASQTQEGIILVGRDIKELISYQEKLKEEVQKRTKELVEAKTVLEIKVKARTRELQELTDSLEEQVKERTKELQKKVEEMERFHKLTIARELKMIKLKKEVEELKGNPEKRKKE